MFQQKNLAYNIKAYRKLRGLTQGELAERLFVTAQNVSKWETGKSVPDVEHLCHLAEVFGVTPDRLLVCEPEADREQTLLAIDGGGSKTEFVLYTAGGRILKRLILGGSNPNSIGMEKTQALLKAGIDQFLELEPNLAAIYAGVAGCGLEAHAGQLTAFLKKTYPMIRSKVASDVLNVIYSAPVEDRCIAVICGTGSAVFAKTPTQLHRFGGWGWLWESGCSGYDFGRDALEAALAAREGLGPDTLLLELVEKRLGGNITDQLGQIYRLGQSGIAGFAATVFEAHRLQDPVAGRILEKNGDRLAWLINTAAGRYDCGQNVVLAGGLTAYREVLEELLLPRLEPGLRLLFNEKAQICGAAVGGCRLLGKDSPEFAEEFYVNYQKIMEGTKNAENRNA